jgi:hypothetical protein
MATLAPIIPAARRDAFDDPAWLFDLKLDGFRGLADTIAGRILSKNGNQLKRFEPLLETLPTDTSSMARSSRSMPPAGQCSMIFYFIAARPFRCRSTCYSRTVRTYAQRR